MRVFSVTIGAAVMILIQMIPLQTFADPEARAIPKLRIGTVACSSDSWSTVQLDVGYTSMIVIASASYATGDSPAIVRVRNASGSSFDVMVQNPCGVQPLSNVAVSYIVIEQGTYTVAADGVKAEAYKIDSSVTDNAGSWSGSAIAYANTYSSPVVIGQVMTTEDSDWSQFWCYDGVSMSNPPSSLGAAVGKHVGQDPDVTRVDEEVGFLVIEAGSGVIDGWEYVAAVGPDTVQGPDNGAPAQYALFPTFTSVSAVITSLTGMDGADGGWAVAASVTPSTVEVFIEEDQCMDTERGHTTEQVAFIAFGDIAPPAGPSIRTGTVSCSSSGWASVTMDHSYDSMVVIGSAHYPAGDAPAVVRIRNAAANSFDVMVQSPCGGPSLSDIDVHYLAIEEGDYTKATDGFKGEASKFVPSTTDHSGSWIGAARAYSNTYDSPVVLGQIMSAEDPDWSQFWCYDGAAVTDPPSGAGLALGKHVGEDSDTGRVDETVGYLVIESGTGVVDGLGYEAGVGADIVQGPDNGLPAQYLVTSDMAVATSLIVGQVGMDDAEGGWAVVTSFGGNAVDLVIEEDQCFDTERLHETEQAGYLILGDPSMMFLIFADGFETGGTSNWS